MCLGIPGKVVETYRENDVLMGKVDFSGIRKGVCLEHVPAARPGEYVLVHVGFALSVLDEAGEEAARGKLVLRGRIAIFDQIETEETHRRRGLGSAVMRALGAEAARRGASRGILVATPAGRALYLSLGWETLSDYTSAFRPE